MPFSALQRAENSSITSTVLAFAADARLSVLFSEPKIPQFDRICAKCVLSQRLSVLFSEPKIPQFATPSYARSPYRTFSALQRAENSSMPVPAVPALSDAPFQCSSASRKFLNPARVPVLQRNSAFQCSSASRKFLNSSMSCTSSVRERLSVLFSEPKIPQSRPSHLRPSIFPTAMITLRHS